MRADSGVARGLLAVILLGYLLAGSLYALRTPPWQTPDEPAHYNYIRQTAETGALPVIEMGDWDQDYLSALTSSRFDPALLDDLATVQYEDHQPPLYYLLMTPLYALSGGDLYVMRLASLLIGTLIVLAAYGVGLVMFPQRAQIGLGAAAFVAFLPQHLAILASVNNDSLGWALAALILWASVAYLRGALRVRPWMLGLLIGVALATKATAYLMAGVAFLALLLRWWLDGRPNTWRGLLRPMADYLVPALTLGVLWWLRNFAVYGFPDFLGLAAHDAVVVGQPRTAELIEAVGWSGYLSQLIEVSFSSFIGRFGWMALPLVGEGLVGLIYPAYLVLFIAGGLGLIVGRVTRGSVPEAGQWAVWLLLGLTVLLSLLAYAYYNTQFQQFQGRYTYPLLIPLGVALALGLDSWRRLILRERAAWLVPVGLLAALPLNVWLLWTVVAPNLAVT